MKDLATASAPPRSLTLDPNLALIFDLDGVIVDSMPMHILAWERYLESLGIAAADLTQRMHGRRNDEIFRDLLGPRASDAEIDAHGVAKEQLFRDMIGGELHDYLVPGVREFLASVNETPTGLATNAERANADFMLDGADLRGFFQVVVDGSQVERPKPAPDVYLRAADELKTAPGNCIVFEDSVVGVSAARAAGMTVVGVLTQGQPLPDVDYSVDDFRSPELAAFLSDRRGASQGGR